MAKRQVEISHFVRDHVHAEIYFCPTYYSYDPVLDRVFGKRPSNYLEVLGNELHQDIQVFWTGPKTKSSEITPAHLGEISNLLQRKVTIWDNALANDGPKQCHYLALEPVFARSNDGFRQTSGWAINPMNQPETSKIGVLSLLSTLTQDINPPESFQSAVSTLCPPPLAQLLSQYSNVLSSVGLNHIDPKQKHSLANEFSKIQHPIGNEIARWLLGDYLVGTECLTD